MARTSRVMLLAALLGLQTVGSAGLSLSKNPIRRVVDMLEAMVKKVEAEGEAEGELVQKFLCYCKGGKGDLEKSIADAEQAIPQIEASIEALNSGAGQLVEDVKKAKIAREEAKKSLAEAKTLREKESAAFAKATDDLKTNVAGLTKAVEALEKGMGGSFLQTFAASTLRNLVVSMDMDPADRDRLSSFLSVGSSRDAYAPQGGEVTGILKTMKDTMSADLAEAVSEEDAAIASFTSLKDAKTKEVEALTAEIEDKTQRGGQAAVDLVNMKEDLEDKEKALEDDKAFLKDLSSSCATKEEEWEARQKIRSEELLAISETIKILNDDDALELFKKTLPGASFLQLQVSASEMQKQALSTIQGKVGRDFRLNFIALALKGKKIGFEKVLKMIDEMSELLGKEQTTDDEKKAYCETEIDKTEDEVKALDRKISDLGKATEDAKSSIEALSHELTSLAEGIKLLDKEVAEATEQRKEEHAEFEGTFAANAAAVKLLGVAKNRMQMFYNPKLAKTTTPAPAEFLEEKPAPPPETFSGEYKKSEASGGVLALIDNLVAEVEKEMQEMEVEEKNAQEEYESLMTDSSSKRASDVSEVEAKEGTKADLEARLLKLDDETKSAGAEVMGKGETLGALHGECDWLAANYDARKAARSGEIESLKTAKAVLSGADFSFLQIASQPAPEDSLAKEMTHDLEMNFNKIAPFGKEDTAKELQSHAAKTQDTLVDAVENAEVAEIKRAVFRALTRLRAATIKEFDTIARLETQAIDAYNDAHHYRAENPLSHLHEDEAPVETDKLKSFH